MVVDKDQINAPYMQKWRSKGIRVITSPVNKSLERLYFEKQLKITCMADTMDEIGIDKLLEDNWKYLHSPKNKTKTYFYNMFYPPLHIFELCKLQMKKLYASVVNYFQSY